MDSGYYAAMAGLVARTDALDAAAANLANAQTTGYRAEHPYFRAVLLGSDSGASQLGRAVNDFGVVGGTSLSQLQGELQTTGNPLDLAIEGQGFFAVQTANGVRYTRDGSFHRETDGRLVTREGEQVLSPAGQPVAIPPGEVTIGSDGAISVAGGVAGSVGLFQFPAGTALTAEGANRYVPPAGVKASPAANAQVAQGALEAANEDVIRGSLDLVVMQRQAEMMQKALTVFHTEMNKFAAEDLGKV
jgi:flagellar basal-body rod protein FlgF/flagellar basal-body rod protein FlgG